MNMFSITKRAMHQSKVWQKKLEDIISEGSESANLIKFNKRKKSLGISGLGTILFGELFGLQLNPKAANVTCAFNLYSSFIDCHIDGTYGLDLNFELNNSDIGFLIDEGINFLETGDTYSPFLSKTKPLVEYIRDELISRGIDLSGFYGHVRQYAFSLRKDFTLTLPQDRIAERIRLGRFYGDIIADLIDIFSEKKLTQTQRQVIQIYSSCGAVHDDFVDVREDGKNSYIFYNSKGFFDKILRLYDHTKIAPKLFEEGIKLINDPVQQKKYRKMFNSLMVGGYMFFIKKEIVHDLKKLSLRRQNQTADQYPISNNCWS